MIQYGTDRWTGNTCNAVHIIRSKILQRGVWKTVVDRSNATRNGLITLLLVGGANEALGGTNDTVGGAIWPVGRVTAETLTFDGDLEVSRTFAVLRSHSSAADSSTLRPVNHTQTERCEGIKLCCRYTGWPKK